MQVGLTGLQDVHQIDADTKVSTLRAQGDPKLTIIIQ